ncbi:MAG: hypothetical protein R3E12_01080 [Candidatus Eisenbacteria bacterium]
MRATWIDLVWTTTGRSTGRPGPVAQYFLAYRDGDLATEQDWEDAIRIEIGLPQPGEPGTIETFRLEGLSPETDYAFAMRAPPVRPETSPRSRRHCSSPRSPSRPTPVTEEVTAAEMEAETVEVTVEVTAAAVMVEETVVATAVVVEETAVAEMAAATAVIRRSTCLLDRSMI